MDDFEQKVVAGIITETFKQVLGGASQFYEWIRNKKTEIGSFGAAETNYLRSIERDLAYTNMLGKPTPISVRHMYVRVHFIQGVSRYKQLSVKDMEEAFDKDRKRMGSIYSTFPGDELIRKRKFVIRANMLRRKNFPSEGLYLKIKEIAGAEYYEYATFSSEMYRLLGTHEYTEFLMRMFEEPQRYIILGKPGAGKTTYLKQLALQAIDGNVEQPVIPIFISLKDMPLSDDEPILTFIVNILDVHGFPGTRDFIARILEKGRALLLFDGLDEVRPEHMAKILAEVEIFSKKFHRNKFVISCRVASYDQYFDGFTEIELADFNDKQIKDFSNNWFSSGHNATSFIEQLHNYVGALELCSSPLLMTLICIAYEGFQAMPESRVEIFEEAFEVLMRKWDSKRRIDRNRSSHLVSRKTLYTAIIKIAASLFEDNVFFFKRSRLMELLKAYVNDEGQEAGLDMSSIVNDVEADHGIWLERAKGIYSFSHLSIQEYLTAKYICEYSRQGTTDLLIDNMIADKRWREVFLLTSQMLTEADDFLRRFHLKSALSAHHNSVSEVAYNYATSCEMDYEGLSISEKIRTLGACANSMFVRGNAASDEFDHQKIGRDATRDAINVYELVECVINIINLHKHAGNVTDVAEYLVKLAPSCNLQKYSDNEYIFDSRINALKGFVEENLLLYESVNSSLDLSPAQKADLIDLCFSFRRTDGQRKTLEKSLVRHVSCNSP